VTACLTFSVSVLTTIPSVTMVLQEICSFGNFSTSTRHMRQFPATESFGW